jgi:formylglycine-generating enzyme
MEISGRQIVRVWQVKSELFMKTKLRPLLIGVVLITGIHSALAQPALGIIQTNKQSLLFWPSNATSFVLQSTTNLASPNWALATDVTTITYGSQTAVTVTNSSSQRFFRLFQSITSTADGMALIPAGSFTIGDTLDGIGIATPTNVYVSAFLMDTNLVRYDLWQLVYSYATSHGYGFDDAGYAKATNHPAGNVNWYDAVKWCNARSQQAGLTPVYYTDAGFTQVYTNGDIDITNANVNWSANGYRLPTSAEWEKAARGGLTGQRFPWGLTISESQANYDGNTNNFYDLGPEGSNTNYNTGYPYTSPVGAFAANGYGLYDMAGNMNEWCWDWYAVPSYPAGSPYLGGTDPRGPLTESVYYRVTRGGGWSSEGAELRCAFPNAFTPNAIANGIIGLRCVRNVPNKTADGMALIPAGSFTIGDTLDGESDAIPTNVYVSAFYMDTNLVSYGQWKSVYNYAINQGYVFDSTGYGKADNQPVCFTVNWYDSVKWCNARSQQAGLTPVYYTDAGMTQVYTNGDVDALYPNWSANGYRLPTEAEWEKAARGGLSGQRFPWGLTISESQANYSANTETYSYDLGPDGANTNFNTTGYPYTSPVGYFAPNGYGLYDMAGNLFEWCWDWYATPPYPAGSPYLGGTDPRGPAANTGARVQRTGAWNNPPSYQRCYNRTAFYPNYGNGSFGFRSVRNF